MKIWIEKSNGKTYCELCDKIIKNGTLMGIINYQSENQFTGSIFCKDCFYIDLAKYNQNIANNQEWKKGQYVWSN